MLLPHILNFGSKDFSLFSQRHFTLFSWSPFLVLKQAHSISLVFIILQQSCWNFVREKEWVGYLLFFCNYSFKIRPSLTIVKEIFYYLITTNPWCTANTGKSWHNHRLDKSNFFCHLIFKSCQIYGDDMSKIVTQRSVG